MSVTETDDRSAVLGHHFILSCLLTCYERDEEMILTRIYYNESTYG